MNVTLKLTLDGLVRALRWRQIDFLENPARDFQASQKHDLEPNDAARLSEKGIQNAQ